LILATCYCRPLPRRIIDCSLSYIVGILRMVL